MDDDEFDNCVDAVLSGGTKDGTILNTVLNQVPTLYSKLIEFIGDDEFAIAACEVLGAQEKIDD